MLGEIGEVLQIQRCKRQFADQTARRDPRVIRWPWSAPELGIGLKLSPRGGHGFTVGEHDEPGQEGLHAGLALWPPLAHQRPLGQLADGDEGDGEGLAGELAGQGCGCPPTEDSRGNVGV